MSVSVPLAEGTEDERPWASTMNWRRLRAGDRTNDSQGRPWLSGQTVGSEVRRRWRLLLGEPAAES